MMHQGNYGGQFSPMAAQYPNSPMQGPASPNDWLAMMRSQPKTWADVQGPAQMRPPAYPVVAPGTAPGNVPNGSVPATGVAAPLSQNPMSGMMMQGLQNQDGDQGSADVIRQRQEMSQSGMDRMQQIAAMMRQRMAG